MKRLVEPREWAARNAVEHAPLMGKQLLQGVCGGVRWLEMQSLGQHIAKRAIAEGFPSARWQRKALGVKSLRTRRGPPSTEVIQGAASGKDLIAYGALAKCEDGLGWKPKRRRVVSYDVLDCTFGSGFHTGVVLHNGRPYSRVVSLDCDPDAAFAAKNIVSEFGAERFRFFCARMSEAKAMFGERSFDAVMLDPGPSLTQLEDPERGFLLDDENAGSFDMRYTARYGISALEYLNTVPQHTLAGALRSYGILSPEQSMKMARCVRRGRPFGCARELLAAVESAGCELPEDGWAAQDGRRKLPMSWKFFTSLRCVVNQEYYELREALLNALLLLRDGGRLVVFSRLGWEEDLIRDTVRDHPHALLCYTEAILVDDVQAHGHSRHTQMWVATRVQESAFVLKNHVTLTEEDVHGSSVRWMHGMFAGQTHGFPAHNLTFENVEPAERRVARRNQNPPLDLDDEKR